MPCQPQHVFRWGAAHKAMRTFNSARFLPTQLTFQPSRTLTGHRLLYDTLKNAHSSTMSTYALRSYGVN